MHVHTCVNMCMKHTSISQAYSVNILTVHSLSEKHFESSVIIMNIS